jgi:hypothetical protein
MPVATMGGKFSRNKGASNERALVIELRDLGYENVRRGLCQEEKKDFRPDVLAEYQGREWSFELKAHESMLWLPKFVEGYGLKFAPDSLMTICLESPGPLVAIAFNPKALINISNQVFSKWPHDKDAKTVSRIFKLKELKKDCDYLVVKCNRKRRLYLRYW